MKSIARYLLVTSLAVAGGCVTQPTLTDAEISSRYPEIGQLQTSLKAAENQDVKLLSAALYRQANNHYKESVATARNGDDSARLVATQGQQLLDDANEAAMTTREELAIVLVARSRALAAGSPKKNASSWAQTEQKLVELGNLAAKGQIADVREGRLALARQYAKLEVAALQYATEKDAQAQIKEAHRIKAEYYAPLTFNQAISEVNLANNVLESDADAQQKAAGHAQQAYFLANRAIQITEIIKKFKQSGMTDEQIVLWYQTQLANAVAPVVQNPDFSQPNKTMINSLATQLQDLVNNAQEGQHSLEKSRLAYATTIAAQEAEQLHQAEINERFHTVQNAFSSDEAEVYRQGNDVLIRAYGFNFASGDSEIQSGNFPLLKKITSAIEQFPESKVQVSGHTDDRGSDSMNMSLSADRASKVAKFLVDIGKLPEAGVNSIGYGKTHPLASNETSEGRAANRRVEILIVND